MDIIISEVHLLVRGPLWHNYLACFHPFKPYVWPNRTTKTCLILPKWADNHFKRDCVTFERRFKTFFHLKMKAWIQKKYNAPLLDSTHDRVFSGMTSSWLWVSWLTLWHVSTCFPVTLCVGIYHYPINISCGHSGIVLTIVFWSLWMPYHSVNSVSEMSWQENTAGKTMNNCYNLVWWFCNFIIKIVKFKPI